MFLGMTAAETIAQLRTTSLTSVVHAEIMRLIQAGELRPGDKVSELVLAQALGISRGPVREALRALEGSGLVLLKKNRGFFVRTVSRAEAADLYEVRAALDGLVGRLAAANASDAQIAALEVQLGPMQAAAEAGDVAAYYPLNLAFHELLIEAAGNAALAATNRRLIDELHLLRQVSLAQGGLDASTDEHRAIIEAIRARDAEGAATRMQRHVMAARARLLAAIPETEHTEQEDTRAD